MHAHILQFDQFTGATVSATTHIYYKIFVVKLGIRVKQPVAVLNSNTQVMKTRINDWSRLARRHLNRMLSVAYRRCTAYINNIILPW